MRYRNGIQAVSLPNAVTLFLQPALTNRHQRQRLDRALFRQVIEQAGLVALGRERRAEPSRRTSVPLSKTRAPAARPLVLTIARPGAERLLHIELSEGVSVAKVVLMLAALVSLFIDQSFGGAYQAIQNYAGGTLGASADELPWTSIGYNSFYYVTILLTPWLVDRLGRKPVFSVGHLMFGAVSLYLATTDSLHGFIVGRCLQGLAQGTFFVCSVATVLTLFPARLRGIAFSFFSVISLSGTASGAFIGGWFVDHAYWREMFALYASFAIFAALVISTLLEAPGPKRTARFDVPGILFAFFALFALHYVLQFGERRDWLWSTDIVVFGVICILGFVGFIWRELCEDRCGFIQLRLFNIRNLAVASVLGFGLGVPLFGANLFLQYAETTLAFPPSTAGALLTLRILAIALVAPVAVLLVNADKLDVRVPVAIGFVLVPISYALLAVQTTSESDFMTFAVALVISGAGFACLFSPIANVMVRSLPEEVRIEGIAIFKITLLLGGSIAGTALSVVYDHSLASFQTLLAGEATLRHFTNLGIMHPSASLLAATAQQAAVLAYADNSKVVALATLLNLPLVILLKKPQPPAAASSQAGPRA
jgi:MFS transporter, DHA2 family, multidrug resistance protein